MAEKEQIIVDTTGDVNDDWMQKSALEVYVEELKIHEELAAKQRQAQAAPKTVSKGLGK